MAQKIITRGLGKGTQRIVTRGYGALTFVQFLRIALFRFKSRVARTFSFTSRILLRRR